MDKHERIEKSQEYFDFLKVVALAKLKTISYYYYNGKQDFIYTEKNNFFDKEEILIKKNFKITYPELQRQLTWSQWVDIAESITLPMLRLKYRLRAWK